MAERSPGGRSWHLPMGVLFIVSAGIVFARQLVLVGPEFFADHIVSAEITNEKISLAMVAFGLVLVFYGRLRARQAI